MDITRRTFTKMCGAAPILLQMEVANAGKLANASNSGPPISDSVSDIEKSIRANFGGGFSLRALAQSNGLAYADIEHVGNRYVVASADLLDWKIVLSDPSL